MPLEEESDDGDALIIGEKRKRKFANIDRGLSDEDYYKEDIEIDDSKDSSDEDGERTKFLSFLMPENMENFKWVNASLFSSK